MEDKIIGFAYNYSKSDYTIETYAIIFENNEFIYKPLKKYEKVFDDRVIKEVETYGFKNMNYWNNYITEYYRDNINSVKK